MAINKKNTAILKERFKSFFASEPDVYEESEHGCDRIVVYTSKSIDLNELNDLVEGISNTMTIRSYGAMELRIDVW